MADIQDRGHRLDVYQLRCEAAAEALGEVLLDPELGGYEPKQTALLEALKWLEIETTCGDCLALDCHGTGEDDCGCWRHEASVEARERTRQLRAAGIVPAEGAAS